MNPQLSERLIVEVQDIRLGGSVHVGHELEQPATLAVTGPLLGDSGDVTAQLLFSREVMEGLRRLLESDSSDT
jgi:hypothetical protein